MRVVNASQMKQIEKNANDMGITYYQMMENAGMCVADFVRKNIKDFETKIILILTGTGNNGGDGFVAARIIKKFGGNPLIMMVDGPPKTIDAIKNFNKAKDCGIEIITFEKDKSIPIIWGSDAIIDAVYGTGFHGELNDNIKSLFSAISDSDAIKFAIDIPSGVDYSGEISDGAFKADFTIALDSLKYAHMKENTFENCGRVVCADIGIPEECHKI